MVSTVALRHSYHHVPTNTHLEALDIYHYYITLCSLWLANWHNTVYIL